MLLAWEAMFLHWLLAAAAIWVVSASAAEVDEYTATCKFSTETQEEISAQCMLAEFSGSGDAEKLFTVVRATSFGCPERNEPQSQESGAEMLPTGNSGAAQQVAVVVQRGGCSFWQKSSFLFSQTQMRVSDGRHVAVKVAVVVVVNNQEDNSLMRMGSFGSPQEPPFSQPAVMLGKKDGDKLFAQLATENVADDDDRHTLVAPPAKQKQHLRIVHNVAFHKAQAQRARRESAALEIPKLPAMLQEAFSEINKNCPIAHSAQSLRMRQVLPPPTATTITKTTDEEGLRYNHKLEEDLRGVLQVLFKSNRKEKRSKRRKQAKPGRVAVFTHVRNERFFLGAWVVSHTR